MTDEERVRKNEYCDRLIKEGIDGREDADAGIRTCRLTDLAVELGRKDGIACALAWYEVLEQRGFSGAQKITLDYGRANALAGERYGTKWQWEQPTLASEIYYLRRAISHPEFAKSHGAIRCMCLNNLGNRLSVAGRIIEALDCCRRVLEIQPNFGMSLCNRARILANYAEALEDPDDRALFYWVAHREASAAVAPTAHYSPVRNDKLNWDHTKEIKEWIESFLDVKGIAALDPLKGQDGSATEEERSYRHWCLANCLYLNPLNDLGPHIIAAEDPLGLPGVIVPVDSPHRFESFFDQMKQEYVSARWSLYEGAISRSPHFSDRRVALQATEPRPSLSLATEKVKTAYRASYSLFDKISFFVNAYMELGIPERQVSFRKLWRPDEKKPIRNEFDLTSNWGFCALFWLSKDLFEEENDEVAEPQARWLNEIRNHLEHKYLRVTAVGSALAPPDDLAYMVSREDLESKALHLLKLSRSALIYLAVGCNFEEKRRKPRYAGLPIEDLPAIPYLEDDKKK